MATKMHALSTYLVLVIVFVNLVVNTNGYVLSRRNKDEDVQERRSNVFDQKIYIAIEDNNQEGPSVTQQQRKWADLAKKVYKYVMDNTKENPLFRASKHKPMFSEPEFKMLNGERTSLIVELNPDTMLNVLSDVLSSNKMQEKVNSYAKKAAMVYRSVRNGLFEDEDNGQKHHVDLS